MNKNLKLMRSTLLFTILFMFIAFDGFSQNCPPTIRASGNGNRLFLEYDTHMGTLGSGTCVTNADADAAGVTAGPFTVTFTTTSTAPPSTTMVSSNLTLFNNDLRSDNGNGVFAGADVGTTTITLATGEVCVYEDGVLDVPSPDAGIDSPCQDPPLGAAPSDAELLAALGGTPDAGGTWTNVGNTYTYTVIHSYFDCVIDEAVVVVEACPTCPVVNTAISGTESICSGASPTLDEATLVLDDNALAIPAGATTTVTWYTDMSLTTAFVGTLTHSGVDNCATEEVTLYAAVQCIADNSFIAAGNIIVTVYPAFDASLVTTTSGTCAVAPDATSTCGNYTITLDNDADDISAAPTEGQSGTNNYTVTWAGAPICWTSGVVTVSYFCAVQSEHCDCTEYIYLNEPADDAVLKFEIDPSTSALIPVANSAGNIPFIQDPNLVDFPHGVAMDPNGNLWVGSTQNDPDPIRKFNCCLLYTSPSPRDS